MFNNLPWGNNLFKRIKFLKLLFFTGILFSVFIGITISRLILVESLFTQKYFNDFLGYFLIWNILLYILDFFDIKNLRNNDYYLKRIFLATSFSFLISLLIRYIEHGQLINWRINLFKTIFVYSVLGILSLLLTFLVNTIKSKNVLIIGGQFSGRSMAREILLNKDLKLNLLGFLSNLSSEDMILYDGDEVKENNNKIKGKIDRLGKEEDLLRITNKYDIDYVIICKDRNLNSELIENIENLKENGVRVYFMDEIYEALSNKLPVFHLSETYYYYLFREIKKKENNKNIYHYISRILNFIFALLFLILSFPILLISAIVIKLESKGPILYKQERVGKNNKLFIVYKLRSMIVHDGSKYPKYSSKNDNRITNFGKIIRRLRIDEFPQFINVLKGDMNIVGPRAEWSKLEKKYKKKIPFYNKRHIIRPGITGWAQVNYDYGANIEDTIYKLQYDLYYIKNRNFFLDVKILLKTIKIILCGKGV